MKSACQCMWGCVAMLVYMPCAFTQVQTVCMRVCLCVEFCMDASV